MGRRALSLLLILSLLIVCLPGTAAAAAQSEYLSPEEAGAYVREQCIARNTEFEIRFWVYRDDPRNEQNNWLQILVDEAFRHTGDPRAGDYLRLHLGAGTAEYTHWEDSERIYYDATVFLSFYTNARQEQEMDRAVELVLEELDLEGLSDYEKILRVFTFITRNVTYESGGSFSMPHTAYNALIEGGSVCQGYTSLFYRLLLECGIDNRCVTGLSSTAPHAWNVVALDGAYYFADATIGTYMNLERYFLQGTDFLENFILDAESKAILDELPVSDTDYPIVVEDHRHHFTEFYVEAACTVGAHIFRRCMFCELELIEPLSEPLGHDMTGWRHEAPFDCGDISRLENRCDRCDLYVYKDTEVPPHDYQVIEVPATCSELGCTIFECSVCGYRYEEDTHPDLLPHTFDEGRMVTEPTENAAGLMVYTCTTCGSEWEHKLPALGCEHQYRDIERPAYCTEGGHTLHVCLYCDGEYYTDETEALGHTLDEGTLIQEPTCTEAGFLVYTCTQCGWGWTELTDEALGHSWSQWETTQEPTAEEKGVRTQHCDRCGQTRSESIPAFGHDHSFTDEIIAPTCTDKGYTLHYCGCGHVELTDWLEPLGHDYCDWLRFQEADCTRTGQELRFCSRCYAGERQSEPELGHDYVDGFCTRCGGERNPFYDISEDAWYYEPVMWATENGIAYGTMFFTFEPDMTCSRAQVVTFLWRAFGEPEPESTDNPFTDVVNDYAYSATLWAVENGITAGTSSTTFSPNAPCTRAQVVTFLWRAMGQPEPETVDNPFTDVSEDEWYYKSVLWAVENGITAGMSPTTFAPNNPCTRAQVVTFLYRALAEK